MTLECFSFLQPLSLLTPLTQPKARKVTNHEIRPIYQRFLFNLCPVELIMTKSATHTEIPQLHITESFN